MWRRVIVEADADPRGADVHQDRARAKFEVWGEEMIEKTVRQSGASGRV